MALLYPDLSHYSWDRHKGNPDWAALRAAGVRVVCLRASYGDPQVFAPTTRYFREMAAGAKAAGMWVGGYHNLIRGGDASIARQVDWFRTELDAADADWAMLDIEPYDALKANGLWPQLADVRRFEDRWDAVEPNRRLVHYLARWFWARSVDQIGLGSPDLSVLRGPLVNANYPPSGIEDPTARYTAVGGDTGPGWAPFGGKTPAVWQFASTVTWPGVSDTEDANAYRGTLADFIHLTTKEPPVGWYLNRALTNFRTTVNSRYWLRDKASDGTIADGLHSSSSDHQPDAAGQPDAGSVDAWDMDVELNGPGKPYTEDLWRVIRAALRHESIQYVIYNRKITSRTWGLGTWRDYDGPNPHDKHVHFNTRESHEASTAPWIIEEDEMANFTDAHAATLDALARALPNLVNQVGYADARLEAIANGRDAVRADLKGGGSPVWLVTQLKAHGEVIARESSNPDEVRALLTESGQSIADAVLAGLGQRSAADILAALTAAGVDLDALRAELDRQGTAVSTPAES